jgi:hypothetical protein
MEIKRVARNLPRHPRGSLQRTFTGTGPGGEVHKPQALITAISFAGALFGLVFALVSADKSWRGD